MTSTKPYLIRAFYEWIVDNRHTPYVVVNAEHEASRVPTEYVEDGRIVLNIAQAAVRNLSLGNKAIEFNAKFNGIAMDIYAPVAAVVAIYAHENGRGMVFTEEDNNGDNGDTDPQDDPPPRGKPKLTVVK